MAPGERSGVAGSDTTVNVSDSSILKPSFSFEILHFIKDSQQQHGLRHGDYQRYRSYCSRRLRRIRKSLHFVMGTKHRFQSKKITVENVTDIRFLYLPLINAERAWSFAMQLKQESNTEPRKRFHLINRLRKAAKYAMDLEKLCESDRCDARTKLESQAYASWMMGSVYFEHQEWKTARDHFSKAQTIYQKLASAVQEDYQAIYEQRVDEIKPNIRYCDYNIGDESAINDLKQMRLQHGKEEDLLSSKLDFLIAQTRERQTATLSEVKFRGRSVAVKHEPVRLFLLNVQEFEKQLTMSTDLEGKVSIYESLLMECRDAIQILRDELKNDANFKVRSQKGDGPLSNLQYLHSYLVFIRLNKTIDRNLLMIEDLRHRLPGADGKITPGKKPAKPLDLVRFYDTIIQNLSEINSLPGLEDDPTFNKEIETQVLEYKAFRCFYLAQSYSIVKKWREAMALYERVLVCIKQASEGFKEMSDTFKISSIHLQKLEELKNQVDCHKFSIHAFSILDIEDSSPQPNTVKGLGVPLIDRLDIYYEDPSLTSKKPNLASFPPNFKPIPCKPLFFDLALNHVKLPSLEDRLEQKKSGGITNLVKGWFWGSKK